MFMVLEIYSPEIRIACKRKIAEISSDRDSTMIFDKKSKIIINVLINARFFKIFL
jgi:hypothetical protein